MPAGWVMSVDWTRQGLFTNPYENVTRQLRGDITVSYGRNEPRATSDAGAGKMTFDLINISRTFSPENTASPIYGKVLPGTLAQYQVTDPTTGSIRTLFSGPLDGIEVDSTDPAKPVTLTVSDGWGIPGAEQLSTPVYSGQRTGYLIGVILDAIGWTGPRDIDAGVTVVPWWWVEGADAATAVTDLVNSEGPPAIAYVDGGTFVFRDRHHRLLRSDALTSQGLYTQTKPAGPVNAGDSKILKGSFTYDHGLNNIVNSVTLSVDQRQPTDTSVVWSTDEQINLGANEVRTYIAQGSDPFINAIVPVPITVSPSASADDSVVFGDYTLVTGSVTMAISRTSGQTCFLTVTAGAGGAIVQGLALRATPLPVARTVQVQQEDTASVLTYTRKKWGGTAPWANAYDADAIAQRIVAVYAQPRPVVTFDVANVNATHLTAILNRRISHRITIKNDELGLNGDFYVEQISHAVRKNGLIHRMTIGAQAADPGQPTNVFTFDTAGKGFNDGFFGVNGVNNPAQMFVLDTATSTQMFDAGGFAS
jgi:hypothetical protein